MKDKISGETDEVASDGLIERQNLNGKTYGRRHLERKLKSVSWEDPKEIVKAVLDDVDKFVEGLTLDALEDDVSLIVVVIPRTATFLRVDKAG